LHPASSRQLPTTTHNTLRQRIAAFAHHTSSFERACE
jgi:hypothetical protein